MGKEEDGLSKLSKLVHGGAQREMSTLVPTGRDVEEDGDDQKVIEDGQKILELAAQLTGSNVFDMQELIAFCATELRDQIREMLDE